MTDQLERVGVIAAEAGIGDQVMETRSCACGGVVAVVRPLSPGRITFAVERHQASQRHRHWIERGGIEALGRWRFGDPPFRTDIPARGTVLEHGFRVPIDE